ncbi:MAG: hypothetical protein ACI8RZ_001534 [Myxococcota bacterium]|jgi:hypothetical protein
MRYSWKIATLFVAGSVLAACGDKDAVDIGIDADADGFNETLDCDDGNAAIYPGADELCDGIDNSCSGEIDDNATDGITWYADGDGDGYGDSAATINFCDGGGSGYVGNADDCDDGSAYAYPGGSEVCDGLDNDCDGTADNDPSDPVVWYADTDADGYGDAANSSEACVAPSGYVDNFGDCDDTNAELNPNAVWYPDTDRDGFGDSDKKGVFSGCDQPTGYVADSTDCNDGNTDVNPAATEFCDGEDSDCDGKIEADDFDDDGDGQADCQGDCDDGDAAIFEGGEEICGDGLDNDCSSRVDDSCPMDAATGSDIQITGEDSYDYMGYRGLDAGGDLNGDGYDDLAIGAYNHEVSTSAYSSGRAYVFFGPMTSGSVASGGDADLTIDGEDSYDYVGYELALGGDVNGDGYDDLIVDGYGDEGDGGSYNGTIYLFLGPVTGGSLDVTNADAMMSGGNTSEYFGQYTTDFVDLDGDGSDEVVGSRYSVDSYAGGLAFFTDPTGEMNTEDDSTATITGSDSYAYMGRSSVFDDFNGDGVADVGYGEVGLSQGFIINGPITGELDDGDADVDLYSNDTGAYAVSQLGSGDFNGDGYVDLAVGSMYSDFGGSSSGLVITINGPISGSYDVENDFDFATYELTSNYMGAYYDKMQVNDIDGDGNADLFAGVAYNDDAGSSAGAVFLNYGPMSGVQSTAVYDRAIYGSATYAYVGRGMGMGDLDGDGADDVIVGAYGIGGYAGGAYVFFGDQF